MEAVKSKGMLSVGDSVIVVDDARRTYNSHCGGSVGVVSSLNNAESAYVYVDFTKLYDSRGRRMLILNNGKPLTETGTRFEWRYLALATPEVTTERLAEEKKADAIRNKQLAAGYSGSLFSVKRITKKEATLASAAYDENTQELVFKCKLSGFSRSKDKPKYATIRFCIENRGAKVSYEE